MLVSAFLASFAATFRGHIVFALRLALAFGAVVLVVLVALAFALGLLLGVRVQLFPPGCPGDAAVFWTLLARSG